MSLSPSSWSSDFANPSSLPSSFFSTYNLHSHGLARCDGSLCPPCHHVGQLMSLDPCGRKRKGGVSTLPEVFCSWHHWRGDRVESRTAYLLGTTLLWGCGELQGSPADGGVGGSAEDLMGQGPEERATEAPLGSHAGQQGRCGLGVSERQEVGESPDIFPHSSASLRWTGSPVAATSPPWSQTCCGSSCCIGSDPLAWDDVCPSLHVITLWAAISSCCP